MVSESRWHYNVAVSDRATAFDPGPMPTPMFEVTLTDEQVAAFRRDGFTSVPRITTDEELEWLRPLYDHLFADKRGAFRGGYFDLARQYDAEGDDEVPQVLTPEHRFPQLRSTNVACNARRISAQLLDLPEADLKQWGHMILKPPLIGGELPWHQDEAYWDPLLAYRAVGCWMPLDVATVESGCMHFLPGSHLGDVRVHRHIGDDPSVHGLITDGVDDTTEVAVPLDPGGATFHHCRTLHRTTPNVSDHARRAWANEYQAEPVALAPEVAPQRPWVTAGNEAWEQREVYKQ